MGAISKLAGLEHRVQELYISGKKIGEITEIINLESGSKIHRSTISRFIKGYKRQLAKTITESTDLSERKAQQFLNVNDELIWTLNDIKTAIAECKRRDVSPEKMAKLHNAALKSLEIVSKRLGEIAEPVQIVINVVKINDDTKSPDLAAH